MFEQDYIMRLIKEMIRTIIKLIFHIDTESPSSDLLKDSEEQRTLDELLDMVDEGLINEAIALLFYDYLNDKTDDFLEQHDFSRNEIRSGLKTITARYGIEGFTDFFTDEI